MIKQPIFAVIALLLVPVLLYFVIDRLIFLSTADRTTGTVISVSAHNARCGSRRRKYNCTEFRAQVQFFARSGERGQISVRAGSERGHYKPTSLASLGPGNAVGIVYNPKRPSEAYEDSFMGVWGTPFMVFIFNIASSIAAISNPRSGRRRSSSHSW